MSERPRLSEEEARHVWRRAAELQAEAASRLEARSKDLAGEPGQERDEGGYELGHVKVAAREAGISDEFVEQALSELDLVEAVQPSGRGLHEAFVGRLPAFLTASRTYEASAATVYQALRDILPEPPFGLVLEDVVGPHPVEGGEMVFEVPAVMGTATHGRFAYDLYYWADVKEVRIRLHALGEERCQVLVAADMGRTKRLNLWVGGPMVGGVALVAGLGGAALLAGPLGPALALAGGGGLVAAAWMQGTRGWRALARYGVGRGQKALHQLLNALGGHLGTDGQFMPGTGMFPPLPPAPPPSSSSPPEE